MEKIWARGYFARSSGKVDQTTVLSYIESQPSHHGYAGSSLMEPVVYRAEQIPGLQTSPHAAYELKHHYVLVTDHRSPLFDQKIAERLLPYVLLIAETKKWLVEAVTILPDHVHLLVNLRPEMSPESCALGLMNNVWHWMHKNYRPLIDEFKADNVFVSSYYVGTCGERRTAEVKQFLSQAETEAPPG
jgi:putative transposase